MAEFTFVQSKGLVRQHKTVTKSDVADQNGALHDLPGSSDPNVKASSQAIMVSSSGNVTVVTLRRDATGAGIDELLPSLVAGIWHVVEPFRQVKSTGTDAGIATIKVGVLYGEQGPGA